MADNWDVFAPLEALVLPGHNVDVMKGLLEQFTQDYEPDNLIDRMQIRDIAFGTAMAEFLRRVGPAVLVQCLEEAARADDSAAPAKGKTQLVLSREDRVLAKAFSQNLGLVSQLIELQTSVIAERDRSAAIFKHDKLKKLRATLRSMEAMLEAAGCSVEDLGDD